MTAPQGIAPASTAALSSTALPAVEQARLPAAVREGDPKAEQAFQTARGFEEMLMQQLTQSMLAGSGLGEEGEAEGAEGLGSEEGSAPGGGGGGMLSTLLPQVLTEGVKHGGSLGLAGQLTTELDPAAARPTGAGAGGTSAGGATA